LGDRASYLRGVPALLFEFESLRSICHEYRASDTLDLGHDRTDRRNGRRIECPVLALWEARGFVEGFGDPLSIWRMVLGLVWPRLVLGPATARLGCWFLVYSALAILAAYTLAAIWGVGIETIRLVGELPDGLTRGTPFQETAIKVIAYSSVTGALPFVLVFKGLLGDIRTGVGLHT
jgi:hypothetical protein